MALFDVARQTMDMEAHRKVGQADLLDRKIPRATQNLMPDTSQTTVKKIAKPLHSPKPHCDYTKLHPASGVSED